MRRGGFDPEPLLAHLAVASLTLDRSQFSMRACELGTPEVRAMAAVAGVSVKTVHRWRLGGRVGRRVADQCAVALNLHPLLLWPDFNQ